LYKTQDKQSNKKLLGAFVKKEGTAPSGAVQGPLREKGPVGGQGSLEGKKASSGGQVGPQGQWVGGLSPLPAKSNGNRQKISGVLTQAEALPQKKLTQNKEKKSSEQEYRKRFGSQDGVVTVKETRKTLQRPEKPPKRGTTEGGQEGGRRDILASAVADSRLANKRRLSEKKEESHKVRDTSAGSFGQNS
jgi:hypothetical protein